MGWWRTNRWWLPLLPLLVLGMGAASAYRVKSQWYDAGLHHREAAARPGAFVTVTDRYDDAFGATSRRFSVQLSSLGEAARMAPTFLQTRGSKPPAGVRVVVLHLDWRADPDQSVSGCDVALVDDTGARYQPTDVLGAPDPCVPQDHEGPAAAATRAEPRGHVDPGEARPATWSTSVSILVPEHADLRRVLVWWEQPDYVELPVPPS